MLRGGLFIIVADEMEGERELRSHELVAVRHHVTMHDHLLIYHTESL